MHQRVEHPAEFRADARLGRFGVTQLFTGIGVAVVTVLSTLMMVILQVGAGRTVLVFLTGAAVTAEIFFHYARILARAVRFRLRPRWRSADASRAVTPGSDATVQDLIKVQAAIGPFLQWLDGYVSVIMRVQAPPSETATQQQETAMVQCFQSALKALAEYRIEAALYADLEPDLNREELERHQQLVERYPAGSGLRTLIEARIAHHRAMALNARHGRRLVYHVRLSVWPADVPMAQKPTSGEAYMSSVVTYLRDAAMAFATELESAGLVVSPLGPEGVRDVAARQLDPVGWRMAEPPKNTDWVQAIRPVAATESETPVAAATVQAPEHQPAGQPLPGKEVFAVIGVSRGAGCTTVATNLALAFRERGNVVAAVSLDGGANTMALRLAGQTRTVTAGDWQTAADTSTDHLRIAGVRGTRVIPGPTRFMRGLYEPLRDEVVAQVVRQARSEAAIVVLDLGSDLTAEQRAALGEATAVLIVASPEDDPRCVQQISEDMEALGIAPEAVGVVLNRTTAYAVVDLPVALVLPEDPALSRAALAILMAPESLWTRHLMNWVQALAYEEGAT